MLTTGRRGDPWHVNDPLRVTPYRLEAARGFGRAPLGRTRRKNLMSVLRMADRT